MFKLHTEESWKDYFELPPAKSHIFHEISVKGWFTYYYNSYTGERKIKLEEGDFLYIDSQKIRGI